MDGFNLFEMMGLSEPETPKKAPAKKAGDKKAEDKKEKKPTVR